MHGRKRSGVAVIRSWPRTSWRGNVTFQSENHLIGEADQGNLCTLARRIQPNTVSGRQGCSSLTRQKLPSNLSEIHRFGRLSGLFSAIAMPVLVVLRVQSVDGGYRWEKEGKQEGTSFIFPYKFVSLANVPLSFSRGSSATCPAQGSTFTQTYLWMPEPVWSLRSRCRRKKSAAPRSWSGPALRHCAFRRWLAKKHRSSAWQRLSIASTSFGRLFPAPHNLQPFKLILDIGAAFH